MTKRRRSLIPTIAGVGLVLLVPMAVIYGLSLRYGRPLAATNPAAIAAGWGATANTAAANIDRAFATRAPLGPLVRDDRSGDYRRLTLGAGELRAYVDHLGGVQALSIEADSHPSRGGALSLSGPFVAAAVPNADPAQRLQTALALADHAVNGTSGDSQLGGVDFALTASGARFAIRASPVARRR